MTDRLSGLESGATIRTVKRGAYATRHRPAAQRREINIGIGVVRRSTCRRAALPAKSRAPIIRLRGLRARGAGRAFRSGRRPIGPRQPRTTTMTRHRTERIKFTAFAFSEGFNDRHQNHLLSSSDFYCAHLRRVLIRKNPIPGSSP